MKKGLPSFLLSLFLVLFISPNHINAAAADPIAHFKFDDGSGTTPDDSSSNNISASFTSTQPTWSSDISSTITFTNPYSLDFTGNGDGVTVTWPANLNFADTDPRSFSFWYKPTANGEGQYSRIISWSNDKLEIAGTNAGATNHRIAYFDGNWNETGITLSLGTWYHVIFTYDGTNARFYINNELQDEHALAGRALSGTLRIGNRVQQLDEGINGKIDDVRIYNYALNSTQIQNLSGGSNSPDGDPTPTQTPTPTANSTPTFALSSGNSVCGETKPESPDLFQISTSPNSATLYFNPKSLGTGFVIHYGQANVDQNAIIFDQLAKGGVMSHTISNLKESTTYSFKMQTKNGCAYSNWSPVKSAITTSQTISTSPTIPQRGKIEIIDKNEESKTKEEPNNQPDNEESQNGYDVEIRVINGNKAVAGAKVELHSTPRSTITDTNGIARFPDVEAGNHTVYIAYEGYTGEEKITLEGEHKDVAINFTVELKPSKTYLSSLAIGIIFLLVVLLIFLIKKYREK